MLKHYIKFAIRNFRANKVIFVGSLATLCLGALCISMLYTYMDNELSMDEFHSEAKEINTNKINDTINKFNQQGDIFLMLMRDSPKSNWRVSSPKDYFNFDYTKYPEIENLVKIGRYPKGRFRFNYNNKKVNPSGFVVDRTFFEIFNFKLEQGDPKTVLNNLNNIVLSKAFAKKMFGDENAIGKIIKVSEERFQDELFTVKGILNIPSNSSLQFDFLIPDNKNEPNKYSRMGCDFILTKTGFNKNEFLKKIQSITNRNQYIQNKELGLISLSEVYFNSSLNIDYIGIFDKLGDKKNNLIVLVIIGVIFFISMLNFSNLQVVNINTTIKQLHLHEINGAKKKQIIYQKLIESIFLILLATFIATICYQFFLPHFNTFFKIVLSPSLYKTITIVSLICLLIVLLSSIYPIIIIYKDSFIVESSLRGATPKAVFGKKVITVLQYALTFVLLISAFTIAKQLNLLLTKDLGFDTENSISTKLFYDPPFEPNHKSWNKEKREQKQNAFLATHQHLGNELSNQTSILAYSQGSSILKPYQSTYKCSGSDNEFISINELYVNPNYDKVYNFQIVEGQFFGKNNNSKEIIINEAAKKFWGIGDISKVNIEKKDRGTYKIIGVVKDFNYQHLSNKPKPLILLPIYNITQDFHIKFNKGKTSEGLKFIHSLFKKNNPNEIFSFSFLSDDIATLYQKEKRLSTIYIVFTIIALLISAIGLFTIALYDTQRRVKEVGVRKVNGASISEIMFMLNKDFIQWVGIAFVIACPIAYYAMSKWLENFAYKTALSWWVFALAGLFTLVIALLTVSWQTYRAATQNPVESLRDE
ncbi:ABC transporter permease [Snuella sedimenti]|uniref:ABC transporter permease n=1 Tax=Snuella sedimenti TaxID=2798802 RepID=A0A8J7LSL1_9FLAO|nr:FtsX-like permease family protein [Snuella sedimenti]MBJ6368550.1 ABC transporter permease [Snuella sedimenti]